jgi:hypothetical protein
MEGKEGKERIQYFKNLLPHSNKYPQQADHSSRIPFASLASIVYQSFAKNSIISPVYKRQALISRKLTFPWNISVEHFKRTYLRAYVLESARFNRTFQ